jgi:hypothetical protein
LYFIVKAFFRGDVQLNPGCAGFRGEQPSWKLDVSFECNVSQQKPRASLILLTPGIVEVKYWKKKHVRLCAKVRWRPGIRKDKTIIPLNVFK